MSTTEDSKANWLNQTLWDIGAFDQLNHAQIVKLDKAIEALIKEAYERGKNHNPKVHPNEIKGLITKAVKTVKGE